MGAIYEVERGTQADPAHDGLVADFGWAHLHAFIDLLAAEEKIDLKRMSGYGGSDSWADLDTALKPLFDLGAFKEGRLPAAECKAMKARLNEIHSAWSRGLYSGAAEVDMKRDQLAMMGRLLMVIGACLKTGRALTVR